MKLGIPNKQIQKSFSQPILGIEQRKRPGTAYVSNIRNLNKDFLPKTSQINSLKHPNSGKPSNLILKRQNSAKLISTDKQRKDKNLRRPVSSCIYRSKFEFRKIANIPQFTDKCYKEYWNYNVAEPRSFIQNIKSLEKIENQDQANLNEKGNDIISSIDYDRNLYKFPQIDWNSKKPFSFLTHLGGNFLDFKKCNSNLSHNLNNVKFFKELSTGSILKKRPYTSNILMKQIERNDIRINESNKNLQRPISAIPDRITKILSKEIAKSYLYGVKFFNENEEEIQKSEELCIVNEENYNEQEVKENHPYFSKMVGGYKNIDIHSSIKRDQADKDFLDIFDRSQRTKAACLASTGDYTFYSSYQRIGCFIDYSMHLKWQDLKELQKKITQDKSNRVKKKSKEEIEKMENSFKNKVGSKGVLSYTEKIMSSSLFNGLMPFEDEGYMLSLIFEKNNPYFQKYKVSTKKFEKIYDPMDFLKICTIDSVFDESNYSEEFTECVLSSIQNYNKYIYSDKIAKNEIMTFNREKLKSSINKKLKFEINKGSLYEIFEKSIDDLEECFYVDLKKIIMNYIIRSPDERKRLNILYFPSTVLPTSYTIAQHGSFNRSKYKKWVNNYTNSFFNLDKNLTLCNISINSLIDWTKNFEHVNLLYLKFIDDLRDKTNGTIHINNYIKIQITYMNKVMNFLKDIYYRGVILIIRKNKAFKRLDMSNGMNYLSKWTFKGFIPNSKEYSEEYKDMDYGMKYEDRLKDFWSNIDLCDLMDVRLTPSNVGFLNYVYGEKIDLESNDYDNLSYDKKMRINKNATIYCTIFFRKLEEKALNNFLNFFESIPSKYEFLDSLTEQEKLENDLRKNLKYEHNDIQLPDIISFKIYYLVNPIISINTKFDPTKHVVKLEYTFEEIHEKIFSIIFHLLKLFNTFPSLQCAEFKKITPTDLEKIIRDHATMLNDYCSAEPKQNKSFMKDYYSNFCPSLIVEECDNGKGGIEYLNIINNNESFVENIKSRIYRKIKEQCIEMDEALTLYDPIEDLIKGSFEEEINHFIYSQSGEEDKNIGKAKGIGKSLSSETNENEKKENKKTGNKIYSNSNRKKDLKFGGMGVPDYNKYNYYINKIRVIKKYISIIPNLVQFPLFYVDNSSVKKELITNLDELERKLVFSIEKNIILQYDSNIKCYDQILGMIKEKIETPEDAVSMMNKYLIIEDKEKECMKRVEYIISIFDYLLKANVLFSEELILKSSEALENKDKYLNESKKIEEMHEKNIETLNKKIYTERIQIKSDIINFLKEIQGLNEQIHITEYDLVNKIIKSLTSKLMVIQEKISKNRKDVENLNKAQTHLDLDEAEGENINHPFSLIKKGEHKLTKLRILWENAQKFYIERKEMIKCFNEESNVEYFQNLFGGIAIEVLENRENLLKDEEIVQKLSKILEDDIDNILTFLNAANELIHCSLPMDENLRGYILEVIESKQIEASCRDILAKIYKKKL